MSLEDLYQELLLDHFKNPRCRGTLEHPDAESEVYNPLCGDRVSLDIKVRDGTVEEIAFDGKGCSISQASASMMGELCRGKPVEEARQLVKTFFGIMQGEPLPEASSLGDAAALTGVRRFPARVRCALIAWESLDRCLKKLSAAD